MTDALDSLIRHVDEDRWLASRFAPADVRAQLIAIYAVDHELARISQLVREPAAGALRLAWWRDALADIHAGRMVPPQPTLQFYATHCAGLSGEVWSDVIAARIADFAPFQSWQAFDDYAQQTVGGIFQLALQACAIADDAADWRSASVAWASIKVLIENRALPRPREEAISSASRAYTEARTQLRGLPHQAFSAIGFVALTPFYLRALSKGRSSVPLLRRQLQLVAAAATGRL